MYIYSTLYVRLLCMMRNWANYLVSGALLFFLILVF